MRWTTLGWTRRGWTSRGWTTLGLAALIGALGLAGCDDGASGDDAGAGDAGAPVDGQDAGLGVVDDGGAIADAGPPATGQDAGPSPDPDAGPAPGVPVWVGVGNFGLIASTRDGVTWTRQGGMGSGNPHTPDLLRGVGYQNGVFIAVGGNANSYILRSTDGETWVDSGSSDPGPWLGGVAGAGGVWVAAGGRAIVRSTDGGFTWQRVLNGDGSFGALRAVGASDDGSTFVASGDGGAILVSHDAGASWTDVSMPAPGGLNDVAYLGGRWVAAGRGWNGSGFDSLCYVSGDGDAWSPCAFAVGEVLSAGAQGGALHVFTLSDHAYSTDGVAWQVETLPMNVLQAAEADGLWVAKRYGATMVGPRLDMLSPVTFSGNFRSFTVGRVSP